MPALRGDPCRLEAGRAAADHEHGLGRRRRLEPVAVPGELAPGRRVHEARDPVIPRPAAPAHLVARDARPHLVGAVGAGLGDQVRVGDLPPDDADHVGLPGGQDRLGRLGRPDVALGLDPRVRDDPLELGGERHAELLLVQRDRDDRVEVEIRAGAAGHVVHRPPLVVPRDDLGELRHRQRGRGARVHRDRQADDEVLATRGPDPFQDRGGEPHPPLEVAAPRVVAAVRPRRPELVDERVVRREDLDAVEPGVLGAARARDEAVDDLLDLGLGHRMAAVGVVVRGEAGGRPVRRERVVGVAVLAHVVQLLDHHDVRIRVAAGVGESAERRDDGVVVVAEVAAGQDGRSVDRHGLHDDHPGATERPLAVVADVPLAGQPALGHVGGVGPEVDPARQRPVAQLEGLEHVRERHRSCSMARWPTPHRSSSSPGRRRPARPSSASGWRRRSSRTAGPRPSSRPIPGRCTAGLDIGTAKVSAADRARVPHAGLDLVEPPERFALADFVAHARGVLTGVAAEDGIALLVGGTGLYVRAVARGIDLDALPDDPALRARLEAELAADGLAPLVERLEARAPTLAAQTDTANPRRVLRALEIAELRGDGPRPAPRGYDGPVTWIGLSLEREEHHRRIATRARRQFDEGLVDEAVALRERYDPGLPAFSAIGYHEAWDVADGRASLDEAAATNTKRNIAFAKRQRTWFRSEPDITWLDATDTDPLDAALASARTATG